MCLEGVVDLTRILELPVLQAELLPNLRGLVPRVARIRLKALDRLGNPIDEVYEGFTAGTIQHEVDHLFGKIFVDRVEDPTTFATWTEFERHHKPAFLETVEAVVAKYHR